MCGIFGYVGKQDNAAQIVLEGLKTLEYRGYDSWGIAVKTGSKLTIEKHVRKIGNAKVSLPKSSIGIGHTRWATHGGVTVTNAHPHFDCTKQVAVLHNGIIENFQELKAELIKKGHTFISQTDTEVFAHLCEEYLKKEEFTSAFRDAFNRLKGLSAIVGMFAPSKEIIAAKTGSPLVIGIGDDELFVASDAIGIIKHTRKVIFLEDNQMAILGTSLKLIQLPKGQEIKLKVHTLTWNFEEADKGNFEHFMLKEIFEQPEVLMRLTSNIQEIKKGARMIDKAFGTYFIGCGTASYACLSGVYLFSKVAKKHVNFSVGSEFNYIEDYLTPESLLIAVSQSGESIDVIEPVISAKNKKAKVIAITNVLGSTLYRESNYNILLKAGPEKCVLGTKSFTSMLANIILLTYFLAGKEKRGIDIVQDSAKEVKNVLERKNIIKSLANKIYKVSNIYILGRGLSYPLALESALKIKESSYIHAEGFAAGELKHGVIALIEKGIPVIVFVPNDETKSAILANAMQVKARGAYVIGIGAENDPVFDFFFKVKDCGASSIIPHVVFSQLLAYYLTLKLGHDPDKPRNLAKSVTVK